MSISRHQDIECTAKAYSFDLRQAEEEVVHDEVQMEMDGDMDIYDLCDHHSSVSYNE